MPLRPGNRTAHCWGTVGALALSHYPAGSRKAEVDFLSAHAGSSDLWLSVPKTVQLIAGALWGYERFRITLPEMGAMP